MRWEAEIISTKPKIIDKGGLVSVLRAGFDVEVSMTKVKGTKSCVNRELAIDIVDIRDGMAVRYDNAVQYPIIHTHAPVNHTIYFLRCLHSYRGRILRVGGSNEFGVEVFITLTLDLFLCIEVDRVGGLFEWTRSWT